MIPFLLTALCFGLVYGTAQDYILTNGNLRLTGGRTPMEGRLEVFYMGQWGTICDDYWHDWVEGYVACRQMDLLDPGTYDGPRYQLTDIPILLDDVKCIGDEERITNCSHRAWTMNNCIHLEDVYVGCRGHYDNIRLVGSHKRSEGRVEVFQDGRWGTVCDSLGWWDTTAADMVCRQLGYDGARGIVSSGLYEKYSDDIIMNFLYCDGDEYVLSECTYTNSTEDCSHYMDAAVTCSTTTVSDDSYSTLNIIVLTIICTCILCISLIIVVIIKMGFKTSRRRRRRRRRRELSHISGNTGFDNPNYPYGTSDNSAYHPTGYPAMPPSYNETQSEEAPLRDEVLSTVHSTTNQRRQDAIYEDVSPVMYISRSPSSSPRDLTSLEEDDKEDENNEEGNVNYSTNFEPGDMPPAYTPAEATHQ